MNPILLQSTSAAELDEQLHDARLSGHGMGLAISFAGDQILNERVPACFREHNIPVFGACSAEEILEDRVLNGGIVTLLLDIPREHFRLRVFRGDRDDVSAGRELGEFMRSCFANPALLLLVGGGGLLLNTEDVLAGIASVAPGAPVYGGLPSSLGVFEQPPFFDSGGIHGDGLYALVLDNDAVDVRGMAVSGWRELGTAKRITRSEGNKVLEIEGLPATEFYEHYFHIRAEHSQLNHIDPELLAASEYPILLKREDGSEVMRAAIRMDPEEKAVYYGGDIPRGSLVRFCSPNIIETIQQTSELLQGFRDRELAAGADAILLFNCAVRSRAFGAYMKRELEVINRLWPAPIIGFSSWGEIGRVPGQGSGFHNTVISMVTLRAKNKPADASPRAELSASEVEALVDTDEETETMESLREKLAQARREKRILSHFLHLTSGDLEEEQKKSEALLLNILPGGIAERLKQGETNISDRVENATILFADLVGFTSLSSEMAPDALVALLNEIYSRFDELTAARSIEKIKTIGDAYMAVAGLPVPAPDHADRCLRLGRDMLRVIDDVNERHGTSLRVRIGLNSGPVVAGVIGTKKFSYDLWGDTVNVASRMESAGEPGCIQVSESTHALLTDTSGFEERANLLLKGKGAVMAYLWRP